MARLLTNEDPVNVEMMRWASEPFVWGSSDCALSVLAYIERVSGRTMQTRPVYKGARGAKRYMVKRGGFELCFRRGIAELGCEPVDEARRGDVGLIDLPKVGLSAAICLGAKWAARGHHEVVILPIEPLAAWRLPCPRP